MSADCPTAAPVAWLQALTKELCLKADRRIPLSVGGVDARLLKYHVLPPKGGQPRRSTPPPPSRSPAPQDTQSSSPQQLEQSSARLLDLLQDDTK